MNTLYLAKKLLVFSVFMCLSAIMLAQIPQQLNYQGALRDAKGFPIGNRAISLRLSIQETGPNGLVYYSEVRQATTNAVGLYSLAIGSPGATQINGNFSQINWANGTKSLKVEIDTDGGANFSLAGTSPLLSVPYALYAKYAENGGAGAQGPKGADGSMILSGAGNPAINIGKTGDYYFNTISRELFGPRNADGTWPAGTVLLQGPSGKNCWDTNGNGIDDPAEDVNGDGKFNTADCQALSPVLTERSVWVGDTNNKPQEVVLNGDISITNTGTVTLNDGAVTLPKLAGGAANQIYTTNALGQASLSPIASFGGWSPLGNAGMADATNFLGTTDDVPLNLRINNVKAGRVASLALRGETSLGFQAGFNSGPTAFFNTFIGFNAGFTAGAGAQRNTLIGGFAGRLLGTSSSFNTALGFGALNNITLGDNNIGLGSQSGSNLTTGNGNILIGFGADLTASGTSQNVILLGSNSKAAPGITNATAIGSGALVTTSNSIVLGAINPAQPTFVGIGTTAPTQKLHLVDGHVRSEQSAEPKPTLLIANGFAGVAVQPGSTDIKGVLIPRGTTLDAITWSTVQLVLAFNSTNPPVVIITPANQDAADSDYWVEQTGDGFILHLKGKTKPISTPTYNYIILE